MGGGSWDKSFIYYKENDEVDETKIYDGLIRVSRVIRIKRKSVAMNSDNT